MEGHTDIYWPGNAIRCRDQSLEPPLCCSCSWVLPCERQCPISCAETMEAGLEGWRICYHWPPSSPDLNPTEHFCEIMFPSYAPQIAQEVRSRRTSPRAPSVISLGARPDVVRLLPSKPLSCCVVAVHNFFAFIFRVSLNSAHCRVLART